MQEFIEIRLLDTSVAYEKIIYQCEGWTLYHTPEWLTFLDEAVSGKSIILGIYLKDQLVGVMPGRVINFGPLRVFGSPMPGWNTAYMGPVFKKPIKLECFFSAFEQYLKRNKYHHAEIVSMNSGLNLISEWKKENTHTYVAPLFKDQQKLINSFSKSCRKAVNRAMRQGVITEITEDKDFIKIYYSQLKQVFAKSGMAPTYPIDRLHLLSKNLKPSGRLITSWARLDGQIIATRIDMCCNGCIRSFGSASNPEMLKNYPNELLRFFIMSWAGQRGLKKYDMSGGGDYKAKFNAELVDQVRLIWSPAWIHLCRNLAQKMFYWRKRLTRIYQG